MEQGSQGRQQFERNLLLHPTGMLRDLYSGGHSPSCKNVPTRLCTEKSKWRDTNESPHIKGVKLAGTAIIL